MYGLTVPSGVRRHDHGDLVDARDDRGDRVHEHARRIARTPARNVDADPAQRRDLHAEEHAALLGREPRLGQLALVELLDGAGRGRDGVAELLGDRGDRGLDLVGRDPQVRQVDLVELLRVLPQRLVAALAHVLDDAGGDGEHLGVHTARCARASRR